MTINHIDQLTQWWDEAEEGVIEKGDTVINRSDGETTVYVATERARRQHPNARILARAPKPKPAWHDAVAVIAHTDVDRNRRVLTRTRGDEEGDFYWEDIYSAHETDDLRDPAPLIEARVTDETVLRALNASVGVDMPRLTSFTRDEVDDMRYALHAALGLNPDTEENA